MNLFDKPGKNTVTGTNFSGKPNIGIFLQFLRNWGEQSM